MKEQIYQLLANSKIENDLAFPYWLYQIEKVEVAGRRFIKLYLFNRNLDNSKLNSITINIDKREIEIEHFEVVSEYNDRNIIGCYTELQNAESYASIRIIREFIDQNLYLASGNLTQLESTEFPLRDDYLCSKRDKYRNNHVVFPYIGEKVWQCSCGRIHNNDEKYCRCGQSLIDNVETIQFDFDKYLEEDRKKEEEERRIKEEQNRKRLKRIKTISIASAMLVIAVLGAVFIPRKYQEYKIQKEISDLHGQYIELWELNTELSKAEADTAYRERIYKLKAEKNYTEIVKMIEEDNQYTSLVSAKVSKDGKMNYSFKDENIKEIYIVSKCVDSGSFSDISSSDLKIIRNSAIHGDETAHQVYSDYYENVIQIITNTDRTDNKTNLETLPAGKTWYFHFSTVGSFYYEKKLMVTCDIELPDGTILANRALGYLTPRLNSVKNAQYKDMKNPTNGKLKLIIYIGDLQFKTIEYTVTN